MNKAHIPLFIHDGHQYHDPAGMVLPSVTTILKGELGLFHYSSQGAANRGQDVHSACQYYDEGDLDEKTLTDEVREYLESYKKAISHEGIKVQQNELRRYSPKYMYAGTVDKIATVNGIPTLIDLKTGQAGPWHRWQTAAYAELVRLEIGELQRFALYIKPDGYQLIRHDGKRDFLEFLALMSAYTIKLNTGYLKKEKTYDE